MNSLHVVIMSGIPGSGKDTYLKQRFPDFFTKSFPKEQLTQIADERITWVSSADDFWMTEDGGYKFDAKRLGEAHGACLRDFIQGVYDIGGPRTIVVNNTNTTELEMAPYVAIANAFGASMELVTLVVKPEIAAARNIHGVSLGACIAMDARIRNRKLPPFWKFDSEVVIVNDP